MHVSNVYKTLGVGVCSCVYSACPEIVTELRKQFTVNKPFPHSNKGPMRLNSVPASQPPPVMKNRISSQPKYSAALLYFIAFAASAWALPTIAQSSISLGTWMCRKMFLWETGSNNLPWNVLLLECKLKNEHAGWCNGGPW